MNDKKKDPPIIHIKVSVTKQVNPSTGELEFIPKYKPEVIPVVESDTVLSFMMDSKSPEDVYIKSVKYDPEDNDQLSPPSISKNQKQVILSDVNTTAGTIHLKFKFSDTKESYFLAKTADCPATPGDEYPQVINEPPP